MPMNLNRCYSKYLLPLGSFDVGSRTNDRRSKEDATFINIINPRVEITRFKEWNKQDNTIKFLEE